MNLSHVGSLGVWSCISHILSTHRCSSAEYHGDIYDTVTPGIESKKLDCECVGGGRIRHEPDKKSILVYGYSQGYGKADHSITVELLKKKYPDYASITFSNDGY